MNRTHSTAASLVTTVGLAHCDTYEAGNVNRVVKKVISAIEYTPAIGTHVLVKPNLLRAQEDGLCCTHPQVVRAVCAYLLDCGAKVTVGDSPAFGSAAKVAEVIGLAEALRPLGVPIVTLDAPVSTKLPSGMSIGISRYALEADAICNVPRVKAHVQMRFTCAVKNMFGCVSGVRKAIAHSQHGDKGNAFRSLLIEVGDMLPPTTVVVDGVTGMHRTGPSGGDPYALGVIGASSSNVALDTAIAMVLRREPHELPLWNELRLRKVPAAFRGMLSFPLAHPDEFNGQGFLLPEDLKAESFNPFFLMRSAWLRFWRRYVVR